MKMNFRIDVEHFKTSLWGEIVFGLYVASVPPEYADIVREVFSAVGPPIDESAELTTQLLARMREAVPKQHPKLRLYVGHKPR